MSQSQNSIPRNARLVRVSSALLAVGLLLGACSTAAPNTTATSGEHPPGHIGDMDRSMGHGG